MNAQRCNDLRLTGSGGANRVMEAELKRLVMRSPFDVSLDKPKREGEETLLYAFDARVAWVAACHHRTHVHCVVPSGGLSPDHQRWIRPKYAGFFLPVHVLSRVCRGKFVAALRRAYARGTLDLAGATEGLRDPAQWHAFVDALFQTDWVVYAKPSTASA